MYSTRRLPLPLKTDLTQEQAFGKAKWMLDNHYPGGGYERAYLDTTLPHGPGHTTVLKALAEAIITQQHTHHITRTLTKHTNNWDSRVAIVEEILRQYPGILPPELYHSPTWVLTEQIPELIRAIAITDTTIRNLIRS